MKKQFLTVAVCLLVAGSTGLQAQACKEHGKKENVRAQAAAASEADGVRTIQGIRIEDTQPGEGAEATKGQKVTVQYTGTLPDGSKFDSSYDHGRPFSFKLGAGQVIEGWDKGIVGMKVGGKRTLTIPPEKAYGTDGMPPVIPPNSTLRFDVELLDVQ